MNSLSKSSIKANEDSIVSRVSLTTKIFVWSVLIEPLIFFHVVPQNISGIGGNISRLLQLIVLIILIFKVLIVGKARFINPFSLLYRNFTYFYILSVIVGILGYFYGSYSFNLSDEFLESVKYSSTKHSFLSVLVHSEYFRPVFEYFIALYFFVYFVVLTQYMLNTKEAINYFFKCFNFVFLTCLIIGFADLLFQALFYEEYWGIPRYLADGIAVKGFRFHSIIGEPRDAFSFLIMSISILTLKDFFYKERKLTFFWIVLILIAAFLTFSFSGILGIIFSVGLLFIFYLPSLNFKKQLLIFISICFILFIVFINVKYSPRMMLYYDALLEVYQSLNTGGQLSPVVFNVMNNIYPIWHLWLEVREFNFFHLFFGNGYGSTSVINNYYLNERAIINPNASIIRMLYENGIIGTFMFIFVFLTPLKVLFIDDKIYNKLKFLMIVMIAMYFAHRSVGVYVFFGISLAVLRYKLTEMKLNSSFS